MFDGFSYDPKATEAIIAYAAQQAACAGFSHNYHLNLLADAATEEARAAEEVKLVEARRRLVNVYSRRLQDPSITALFHKKDDDLGFVVAALDLQKECQDRVDQIRALETERAASATDIQTLQADNRKLQADNRKLRADKQMLTAQRNNFAAQTTKIRTLLRDSQCNP